MNQPIAEKTALLSRTRGLPNYYSISSLSPGRILMQYIVHSRTLVCFILIILPVKQTKQIPNHVEQILGKGSAVEAFLNSLGRVKQLLPPKIASH